MDYNQFIKKRASEKITLAHVNAKAYMLGWQVHSGNVYYRDVDFICVEMHKDFAKLEQVATLGEVVNGKWFFDITAMRVYIYDASISDSEFIVTFRLLFSDAPCDLSWDLSNSGVIFPYENRLSLNSAFNIKVEGSTGTALVGAGKFSLENTDGYFNNMLTGMMLEGQSVKLYSWARELVESESVLLYDGVITDINFDSNSINIQIKNNLQLLSKNIQSETLTDDGYLVTGLIESNRGIYKSRIWGKVAGVMLVNISGLTSDRYNLTGSLSLPLSSTTVTGTGTQFLDEISSGDTLIIGDSGNEHLVIEVVSNTSLTIEEPATSSESGTGVCVYESISPVFNRVWNVSGRALRETSVNIVQQPATTIIEVSPSTDDLLIGDVVEIRNDSSYYTRTIKSIFANNVVLNQSIPLLGTVNTITRQPVTQLFYNGKTIPLSRDNFTITNDNDNGCYITLTRQFETVGINPITIDLGASWSGSSGTNLVTRGAISDLLLELIKPRDYLVLGGQKYEVASVVSNESYTKIRLASNLTAPVSQTGLKLIKVNPIKNDSILSADVIGETENSLKDGLWISTGPQWIKQQLIEAGFGGNLDGSFDESADDNLQLISLIAPISPNQKNMPKLTTLLNNVNQSLGGCLFVNNSFQFSYKIFDFSRNFNAGTPLIEEYDVIDWSSKSERNELYKEAVFGYNKKQVDPQTNAPSFESYVKTNQLSDLLNSSQTYELETCLVEEQEARAAAHRKLLLSQFLNTVIQVKTDLRYYNLNILDLVQVKFKNIPKQFSDLPDNSRYMIVIEIKKDGDSMSLTLADLGNAIQRRGVITPNTALDYVSEEEELRDYGFITDNLGVLGGIKGRNLIF